MKYFLLTTLFLLFPQFGVPEEHISDSLEITHNGEIIAIVNRVDFTNPYLDTPLLELDSFEKFVADIETKVYQPPENAMISDSGKMVDEKIGHKLNYKKFTELFYDFFYHYGQLKIEAPLTSVYPKVDSELLSNIHTQHIGRYVTYFRVGNKQRVHNIELAAEAINNHVVFPGEIFSFNKVVGKRTKEKGYLPAPVIVKGELSEGIGGGICQVSSTLFNAVDKAGLKIIERYSHSRSVPYVPPGRDATVSWYGPDFTFKNNYNQPILLRTKVLHGQLIVNVFSSDSINYQPKH